MHRRTGTRHHQGGVRLPPVLLAGDLGSGGRVVFGLFGLQSQALPYLIQGVAWGWSIFPGRWATIADPVLPATACRSGACARAVTTQAQAERLVSLLIRSLRQAASTWLLFLYCSSDTFHTSARHTGVSCFP